MTDALGLFAFDDALVRTRLDEHGEPWFVAKDVCAVLEIEKYRDALATLDDDEKGCPVVVDTLGGKQEMATVSESGLYSLIFRSRKPEARRFRKWVTAEVLPALRQTGRYGVTEEDRQALNAVPERVKLAVMRQLCLVARNNAARAGSLERDFIELCSLVAAPAPAPLAPGEQPPLVRAFWDIVRDLEAKGHPVNHTRMHGYIALNLPQVIRLAREENYYSFDRAELFRLLPYSQEPLFVQGNKGLRSVVWKKPVKCWVFSCHADKGDNGGNVLLSPGGAS